MAEREARKPEGQWRRSGELWTLPGISSTHSARFKPGSRGKQASAACTVALALAHLLDTADWRAEHLELALDCGDRLYRASSARQPRPRSRGPALACHQLEPEFYVGAYKCRVCIETAQQRGSLRELEPALAQLLAAGGHGVLASGARCAALWGRPEEGLLLCFEPGPGAARLVRGPEPCLLAQHLAAGLGGGPGARFRIERVRLVRVAPVGRGALRGRAAGDLRVDERRLRAFAGAGGRGVRDGSGSPLRRLAVGEDARPGPGPGSCCAALPERRLDRLGSACQQLWANVPASLGPVPGGAGAAILRGCTHEGSEAHGARGAQRAANCAMALGVKRVQPVRTWVRQTVEQVLALGDKLFAQVTVDMPGVQSVTGAELDGARFEVGGRGLVVVLELLSVVGTLVSKVPAVANLRQGLQEFFLDNTDGILECSSACLALWREEDYYYQFDSRACDANGLRVLGGEAGKGDASSAEKRVVGKACVMRFANLASLDAHIRKNIDPSESHDRYVIRRTAIVEDVPGTRDWNSFKPAVPGKGWILRGHLSSDSRIFDDHSRGVQGLAMAVVALISATTIPAPNWFREDVDDVIRQGDAYYNWCIPYVGGESDGDDEKSLNISSLKKYVYYKKSKVTIDVRESCVMGDLQVANGSGVESLENGVCRFFETQQFGIVEANNAFFAIWKFEPELKDKSKETSFYMLHDNPTQAFISKILSDSAKVELSACVFRFVEATEIAAVLSELLQIQYEQDKSDYFIHRVQVASISEPMTDEEIQKDKAIPIRPELRNYVALGEFGATLAGSFNQNNLVIFKRETRNKQQAASALVALAMTKIFDPYLWYREIVDDILKMADKITTDNLSNLPEGDDEESQGARDYLLPSEIENDFALGVNQISVTVEEDTFTGKPDQLQQTLQDFFSSNRMGIFRQDKIILPIWRENRVYFTVDPVGKQTGKACIYWFINVQSFVDILLECSANSDGSFTIDTVTVDNKFTESEQAEDNFITEDHWYNFSTKSQGIWQIECKTDGETGEEDNNKQEKYDTAISIMAIIFSKAYEARFWSTQLIGEIMVAGKTLHSQSVARLGEDKCLRPNEIIHEFFIADRRIVFEIQDCVQAGKVKCTNSKIQSLRDGCVKFFEKFTAGCLSLLGCTTLAIWTIEDHFYSFKPEHSLMRFANVESLVDTLESNGNEDDDFEVTSIEVLDWNQFPPWKLDPSPAVRPSDLPPINAYCRLPGKARAVLRGFTHQESEIFPEHVRGRQTAANCITCLAMSVIKNPVTWTRKTLDDILALGLDLHLDSCKASGQSSTPTAQDILRVFQIGPNVLAVDVEAATVTGVAEQPPVEAHGGAGETARPAGPKRAAGPKRVRAAAVRAPPLAEALDEFFEGSRAGLLVAGRCMLALWRASGVYFAYDPSPRNSQGSSCACWFACKQPLLQLLAAKLSAEGLGPFRLCRARARRLLCAPLPAPLVPGAGGTFARLPGRPGVLAAGAGAADRGPRSCAIACVGLVVAALHAPASWSPALLGAVLRHGEALHAEVGAARNLTPGELPRALAVGGLRARLRLREGLAAGLTLEADLLRALALFFAGSAAGILHTAGLALAVLRHWNKYYLLDPCGACLLRCDSLAELAGAVVAVCAFSRPAVYSLNAVQVEELHFFSP